MGQTSWRQPKSYRGGGQEISSNERGSSKQQDELGGAQENIGVGAERGGFVRLRKGGQGGASLSRWVGGHI